MERDSVEPNVTELPGERAEEWIAHQRAVAAPSTHVYDFVWDVTSPATGPFCTDPDGNVLMDFTSHVASAPLGYNSPALAERLEAFDLMDPLKIAGHDFYTAHGESPGEASLPGPADVMHRLTEITEAGLDRVFLSNSGAEAVENAIKICYDYRDGAKYGITFDGAFHGRTLGALSLNRSKAIHRRDFPEVTGITSLPFCVDRSCTPGTCGCGFFPDGPESQLRALVDPHQGRVDPDEVAYVIVEPIQGEGGYRIPSEAFTAELGAVCEMHEIPVIADEIQTGMGRTGEWWGSDHWGIQPDVMTVAKALRVGATVSRPDVFPSEKSRVSSTWGAGDLVSSLIGALTIDIIESEDLLMNASVRGDHLLDRLRDHDADYVVDVRGRGLMVAVEFDSKARRDAVMECCFKRRGLLVLPCGHRSLRLLPPLDVTEREIELGADLFMKSIGDREVRSAAPELETGDDAS